MGSADVVRNIVKARTLPARQEEADMRASTAFFVGMATVALAIVGGLGGGLLIGDIMSPSPPQRTAAVTQRERPQSPPLPAAGALPYTAATLAFTDPSLNGREPPPDQHAASSPAPPPAGSVSAAAPGEPSDNAAAPQPTQKAQQAPSAKQTSAPEDAFAKAHDADLKHAADKRRAERAQRWADRHRRDQDQDQSQNIDQQARDDHNGDRDGDRTAGSSKYSGRYSDNGGNYSDNSYSDRRYRDNDSRRYYRDADRDDVPPPPYAVDEGPRFAFPRIQLFGPDD
jgi:type IV secretory pathway VirB10-like protein